MREGWTYKTFGEVGTFLRGKSIQKADFVEKGLPCIHYGQIHTKFGISVDRHLSEISQELYNKSIIASPGDVIIAITSEDLEGSCKSTAWLGDYDIAVSAHAAVFKHNLNPKFIAYYLRSKSFYIEKEKYARGFKVMEIKPTDIAKIPLPIPSADIQAKVVAELDKINELITQKESQLRDLDNLAQSIFYEMFGNPVENEKGWEVKKLGEVCELKAGKAIKASELSDDNKYPCYGGNGVRGYINKCSHETSAPIIGRQGAYCGTVNYAKAPFYATEHAVVVTTKEQLEQNWLYYTLINLKLSRFAKGQAQPGIAVGNLNEYVNLPLPPLPLQQSFASKVSAIETQKASIKQSIHDLETLLASRMQYWFD